MEIQGIAQIAEKRIVGEENLTSAPFVLIIVLTNCPLMKTATLILALFILSPAALTVRADTLAELVASAGTEWMMGKWTSEDGNVSLTYTWKLDKNAVGMTFKMGDRESEGMSVLKPGTEEVVYGSVDNEGTVSSGKWQEYNDSPTLFTTAIKQDGTERKMAVEHIKTDADTMTVKLYAIGDYGKPDDSKSGSLVFKRAK